MRDAPLIPFDPMRMLSDRMARKATDLEDAGRETGHAAKLRVLKIVVFAVGPFDRDDTYELVEGQALKDYGLEQMGQIVQDFYTISNGGKVAGKRYRPADYAAAVPIRSAVK